MLSIGLFYLILSVQSASAAAPSASQVEARKPMTLEALEAIVPEDPRFLSALNEIQKVHYKQQMWDKFFAYAIYYRKKFLTNPETLSAHFKGRMIALEALALARHCMWDEAHAVARYGVEMGKRVQSKSQQELETTLTFVELFHKFPKEISSLPGKEAPSPLFSLTSYWPAQDSLIESISHPKVLRFKLQSKCKE